MLQNLDTWDLYNPVIHDVQYIPVDFYKQNDNELKMQYKIII